MRSLPQAVVALLTIVLSSVGVIAQNCTDSTDVASLGGPIEHRPFGGLPPATLSTPFPGGVSIADGGVTYFTVTTATTIYVQEIAVHTSDLAFLPMRADVYRTTNGSTHLGNETNAAAWIPVSVGLGQSGGPGAASVLRMAEPFVLLPGTHGIAVHAHDFSLQLTPGPPASISDPLVTIAGGSATDALFAGAVQTLRPNVSFVYKRDGDIGVNTRVQTIVPSSRFHPSVGPLHEIAFSSSVAGEHFCQAIQIRMLLVPNGFQLTSDFNANAAGAQTVLSRTKHAWSFYPGPWSEIGLETPFYYDGVSDVLVEVIVRGNVMFPEPSVVTPGFYQSGQGLQCAWADNWFGATPSTATNIDTSGLKMRFFRDCAARGSYGASCSPMRSVVGGTGVYGTTVSWLLGEGIPNEFAFLVFGFEPIAPSPIPLDALGWVNCSAFTVPVAIEGLLTGSTGVANFQMPLANDPTLEGKTLVGQWLQFNASLVHGVQLSNYAMLRIGSTY